MRGYYIVITRKGAKRCSFGRVLWTEEYNIKTADFHKPAVPNPIFFVCRLNLMDKNHLTHIPQDGCGVITQFSFNNSGLS